MTMPLTSAYDDVPTTIALSPAIRYTVPYIEIRI